MLVSGRDTLRSKFSYGGNGGSASGILWALPVATEPPGAGGALFECAPRFVVADSTRLLFRSGTLGVWNVMRAAAFETAATGRPWLLSGSGTFGVSVVPLVAAAFEAAATGRPWLLAGSGTFGVSVVPLVAAAFEAAATGLAAAAWVVAGAATSSAGGGPRPHSAPFSPVLPEEAQRVLFVGARRLFGPRRRGPALRGPRGPAPAAGAAPPRH